MEDYGIIKDDDFSLVGDVKSDSKNRILLGAKTKRSDYYRMYRNSSGQIILDPMKMVPAREAWLYKNDQALSAVLAGLKQSAEGEVVKKPSLSKHAEDPID